MKQIFPWEANPAHTYFEILLVKFWGYSLGVNKTYPSKSFKDKEKNFLKAEVVKLPHCPLRMLLLYIIDFLGPPPEEFKFKSVKIKADKDKLIYSQEIMAMSEVFFRIIGLAFFNMRSVEIYSNIRNSLLLDGFKEEHIARFLTQFWNTSMRNGFSSKSRLALVEILESDPALTSSFKPLLEAALSDKPAAEKMVLYEIRLKPHQQNSLNSRTLQNNQLALYQASKQLRDGKTKSEHTKSLKEYLSIYPEMSDLIQNDSSDENRGNLLGDFSLGGGHE